MPLSWRLFRIVCILQMLAATYFIFVSLAHFFNYARFISLLNTTAFTLIAWLAIFALNLLNSNYPDKPVVGKQKTIFNWLFLLNFLLVALLFAHFFSNYRILNHFKYFTTSGMPFSFSFRLWWPILALGIMIIFQFILLYGLYILRRLLYLNFFSYQQFEFENGQKS